LITDYGKRLGDQQFLAIGSGYREIAAYLTSFGSVTAVGVEGTGSYGAELARVLAGQGFTVREVNRPNRAERRLRGKSDPLDAYQAAESVLTDRGTSTPKARDGYVEALRVLRTVRASAMKARTAVLAQISAVLVAAPEEVRSKYRGMSNKARAKAMAVSRPSGDPAASVAATLMTLKRMGARYLFLSQEISDTDAELEQIISTHAPAILDVNGVGTVIASQLLVTFGDNPARMTSEAAFAALAGAAPVPASSGKTNRHRLSRGGDRQANSSLYRIVLARMSSDQRTRNYVAKRTEDGLSKKEIIRCLKRYVAREIYRVMKNPQPAQLTNDLRPLRLALGLTLTVAAGSLGTWPTSISRIERGTSRDLQTAERYRIWLEEHAKQTN
jgi:transposase